MPTRPGSRSKRLFVHSIAWGLVLTIFGIACQPRLAAQSQSVSTNSPTFEVASIKPHQGHEGMIVLDGPDPGRYSSMNISAKMLIEAAYGIQDFQLTGGPSWIDSERFDIDAKIDDVTANQLRKLSHEEQETRKGVILRSLLADRFNLKVTHVKKELPVFALVVADKGAKIKQVAPPPPGAPFPRRPAAGNGPLPLPAGGKRFSIKAGLCTIEGRAEPLSQLTDMLSMQEGRPVLDQTGMKGTYDFTLEFAVQTGPGGMPLPPAAMGNASETAPSLFSAIQEQLGLRLESTKALTDTIVIDHIDEPSAN